MAYHLFRSRRRSSQGLGVFVVAAIAALVLLPTSVDSAGLFNPKSFELDNGLQVVLIEDHRAPVVTQMIWYRAGSADEPRGKSGIAHFLEHLMFKGTRDVPVGEFSETVTRNGGRENAFTSYDYTGYFQTVASDRLETVMRLEADRMTNLTLTEEQVVSERLVILEERRSRVDNTPTGLFFEQMNAAQYLAYPYRIPVIGWESEIRTLTLEDALSWYRTYYTPNNAILVVAGDVSIEQLRSLAEKYYGVIPRGDSLPRIRAEEPPQLAARRLEMFHAQVTQDTWRRSYIAPSYNWGDTKHALPLQILSQVLGGRATSRIYRDMVVERQIAVQASAFYSATDVGPSQFFLFAIPRGETTLDDIEARMDALVADVLVNGITQDELDRTKRFLLAQSVYARDNVQGAARIFGEALTNGRTTVDVESWPDRIQRVTLDEVNAAARHVFDKKLSVTGLLRAGKAS
ncbi:MAG: pitrilysin family protein [Proteobacteria bacterium]|nr:pitrilysin family protein [Pseudomonadota bacterium]MDA1058269.1 pitrilysin family protein [Pseudomonadota bacterium]